MRGLTTTDRGLTNGILLYFATLVVSILLWITLNDPFNTLMTYNENNCATSACTNGTTWISQGWNNYMWPLFFLGMLLLVGWAIYETRGLGR